MDTQIQSATTVGSDSAPSAATAAAGDKRRLSNADQGTPSAKRTQGLPGQATAEPASNPGSSSTLQAPGAQGNTNPIAAWQAAGRPGATGATPQTGQQHNFVFAFPANAQAAQAAAATSDVHGPAWPESPGFGLAFGGSGFPKP